MLGYIPAIILQCIGVLIPFVGIIIILRKGQGNSNMFLVMANFGALIMNWSAYLLLRSSGLAEALSIYKSQYVGTVLFYIFFILFINSFIDKGSRKNHFIAIFGMFMLIEAIVLIAVVIDNPAAYRDASIEYIEDNGRLFAAEDSSKSINMVRTPVLIDEDGFSEIAKAESLSENNLKRYAILSWSNGKLLIFRYLLLAMILLATQIYALLMTIKQKIRLERNKYIYLTGSQLIVFISLMVCIFSKSLFNVAPFMVSCAVLWVICGTASGNFFSIRDMGRSWVLDHSDSIFIIIDNEGRFLDANEYTKEIFPELKTISRFSFISDEAKANIFRDNKDFELNGRMYVKKVADIEVDDRIVGHTITIMDMTEHYRLVKELDAERQKALDANAAKSNFMSNMSHEIRTPMNAIVGMTEIMLRHEQDEFNTEYLKNIRSSGNALISVVNDILDFSKIESGKLEIIPEEYEIMSVLNDLSLIFLNRIEEKPLQLLFDIDPAMPNKLYGDPVRIKQILLNIVNNGIKYSDSGHVKLTINLKRRFGDEVVLDCAVEDTGIGIKEEDIPKLFSTFSQVDKKKNRGKEGTGLGLSIAKQLIELMGGEVTVESEYGVGTTFRFKIVQKVVDSTPAVSIKSTEDIYVTGFMAYKPTLKHLRKICDAYDNIHFVDQYDVIDKKVDKVDYVFLDKDCICKTGFNEEERDVVVSYGPEFVMINNPMANPCDPEGITLINSPLYTLNFCLAINHEVLSFEKDQELVMSFTAPEANILVVDDNEMNRKVVVGLLEPLGCNIDTAADGNKAVMCVEEKKYDIVLMDHMMPVMDGIEATMALRIKSGDYYQNLPIIALSANALEEARKQFVAAGMNDFLAKPIKTKELFMMIKKYLPPEKIISGEGIVENVKADDYEEIPEIDGLDVKAGIENSGGLDIFISMLGDFYKLIDRKSFMIEQYLLDGFIRDYTIEVHALKNTARMIGALELSDMFYKLELAGNGEDYDTIDNMTGPTLELYRSYKAILRPYAVDDNLKKEDVPVEEIISCINKIKDCMDGFDLDGVDEAMKQLNKYNMPDTISADMEELEVLITDVAMEDVINLCDKIIGKVEG